MAEKPIEPAKIIASRYSYEDQWLKLRSDTVLLPNGRSLDPYHAIELPDWVNVVAITDAGNIVLIEQYRHVVGEVLVEIPAGHVDSGETPDQAVRRELLEETGYAGGTWHHLGSMFAVASRFTNQVHSYLAFGVNKAAEPAPDSSENIRMRVMPWAEFVRRVHSGDLRLKSAGQSGTLLLLSLFAGSSADPELAKLRL
jgi:8-oxo-dGTP pyrophosphatase MutT (NUDIX family)